MQISATKLKYGGQSGLMNWIKVFDFTGMKVGLYSEESPIFMPVKPPANDTQGGKGGEVGEEISLGIEK